ncbi:endonuclease/exonuclease/phosphatase family protein [Marinobacter sp.]|uniref:endonuclease/exonuclease/phosphatase family protein n=1 Tax=Gammaproteobacteria TaxID=1236 RepID=UPI003A8D78A7
MKHPFKRISCALFLLVSFAANGSAYAQELKVRSQNFLHLGWGTATVKLNKCAALSQMMQSSDVIVVQELMQSTDPCQTQTTTNNFRFIADATPLGNSSYKEYYGFYITNKTTSYNTTISYTGDLAIATGKFERIPRAIALEVNDNKTAPATTSYVWVGNIHSIFGKRVKQRYDEAIEAKKFYNQLRAEKIKGSSPTAAAGWPVIIAGDWNIPVKRSNGSYTTGFAWLGAATNPALGEPEITPTSLSATAKRVSAYDHFIYSSTNLTLSSVQVERSSGYLTDIAWRQNVSDHLGITAEVTFK